MVRSRLIRQPAVGATLRVRLVRNAEGSQVVELSELVRAERDDEALQVLEGGRVHLEPDALGELVDAMRAAFAEAKAEEARTIRAPRLKTMPRQPAPSRPTTKRPAWTGEGEF